MADRKPERFMVPLNPSVLESDTEIRFELPFISQLGHLYYIGVNSTLNWTTQFHFHDHFELCYLDHGQVAYQIDKSLHRINEGELFLTKPGECHHGLAGNSSPFRLYYIGFRLEKMLGIEVEYYNIGINRVVQDDDNHVKLLFDSMVNEVRHKKRGSMEMVHGLFLQLLATVLRLYLKSEQHTSNKPRTLGLPIVNILDYLHEEIRYDHNIEQIAKRIHISRSHLARQFKAVTGITIRKYINSLCLDMAKYQLRETNESISVIGEKLRFTSIQTFSIFFKHITGISPLEYRKFSRK